MTPIKSNPQEVKKALEAATRIVEYSIVNHLEEGLAIVTNVMANYKDGTMAKVKHIIGSFKVKSQKMVDYDHLKMIPQDVFKVTVPKIMIVSGMSRWIMTAVLSMMRICGFQRLLSLPNPKWQTT